MDSVGPASSKEPLGSHDGSAQVEPEKPSTPWALHVHGLVLAIYAIFGKGASYLGLGSLYIGEISLVLTATTAAWKGRFRPLLREPVAWALACFILYGALRTIPGIPGMGLLALRDAVIWGYAVFAFAIAAILLGQPQALERVTHWYAKVSMTLLVVLPLIFAVGRLATDIIPSWPGSSYHLLYHKPGDILVHMAALIAFFALGLGGRLPLAFWILAAFLLVANACLNRGGLIAVTMASLVVISLNFTSMPVWRHYLKVVSLVMAILTILLVGGLRIELNDYNARELSFRQVAVNAASMIGQSQAMSAWVDQQDQSRQKVLDEIAQHFAQPLPERPSQHPAPKLPTAPIVGLPMPPTTATSEARAAPRSDPGALGLPMPPTTSTGNLDDNVNWRKQWWEAIATRTWRENPWFGVGFGTHLAHAFGFTKIPDDSVRSPHSIHVTWLARGGLVGLGLWMLINILWIGSLWAARRRFVAAGLMTPAHLSTWCMCVWVAMGLNASFDIYLEGPAGGIWYWSIIGLGLFLIVLSKSVQAAEDRSLEPPLAKGSM